MVSDFYDSIGQRLSAFVNNARGKRSIRALGQSTLHFSKRKGLSLEKSGFIKKYDYENGFADNHYGNFDIWGQE